MSAFSSNICLVPYQQKQVIASLIYLDTLFNSN